MLPEGSRRKYKNGHKPSENRINWDPPAEPEPPLEDNWLAREEPWSYEEAAEATEPDPEPAALGDKPPKTFTLPEQKPHLSLTRAQRADIEAKIAFWLELGGSMLAPLDDVCGPVIQKQTPEIAKKLLPIVAESPEVAGWFLKAGNFTRWADLAMACWPVISVIIAHHVTKTKRSSRQMNSPHPSYMYSTDPTGEDAWGSNVAA